MPEEAPESSAMDYSDMFSGIQVADLLNQVDLERDPEHMVAMKFAYFICFGADVLTFVDQNAIRGAFQKYVNGLKTILPNHTLSDIEMLQVFRAAALLRMNEIRQQMRDQIDAQRLDVTLQALKRSN